MEDVKRPKVLVVGLDGATWSVLEPWMQDGTLPNLAAIRERGVGGDLASTYPPLTPPAWATFLTGKNPGKHGVFHFARVDDDVTDLAAGTPELVDSRDIRSATIWDIVSHHDRQLVTINVPMSYPPRPVNGVMVTCLLTPADATVFTYPPELSELLPDYRIDLERFIDEKPFARDEEGAKSKRTVEPSLQLLEEFAEMERSRAATALELARTEPWDVFTVVFTAPDRMGHYLWNYHLLDEGADAEARRLNVGIREVYGIIDAAIGDLVAAAGEDVHVVVLSDHGMGPTHTSNVHWNSWLLEHDLLRPSASARSSPDALLLRLGLPRDRVGRLVRRIPGIGSSGLVERMRKAPSVAPDTQSSEARYVRLFDPLGGIAVQATGQRREEIIGMLLEELPAVTDPRTGRAIVRTAFRREEYFEGPAAERMPDVLLLMDPAYGSSTRVSNYSSVVTERTVVGDSGAHQFEGIFMLTGPEVQGATAAFEGAGIVDIAPTILHLLDLPVPDDMDGTVLGGALTESSRTSHPVRSSSPLPRWPSEEEAAEAIAAAFTSDDERVRERLRDLGYVE